MRVRLPISATLVSACVLPSAAAAADGVQVRHERVTYGPHTSMVTVVSMPRPGGNRVLMPALPGGIVSSGTATVSAVSGKLARNGTAVAINADLFEYATGQPSGLLLLDGEIYNQPQGERPALQVDGRGTLHTSSPRARGALVLPHKRVVPFQVNVRASKDDAVFYDRGWGPSAPSGASHAIVGKLVSGRLDNRGQTWTADGAMRVVRSSSGALAIPPDASPDELFQAAGEAGARLGRVRAGQTVGVRYRLGPLARDVAFAIGGGPVLIRDGKVVFSVASASRAFTSGQLVPPDARTAVGQLRNGRILFYAADKGAGSTGLTISEVARDLHRRGAVTAMAFDSGGSTSVALNGRLLNQPSDGVERPVGNQLVYFVGDRQHRQPIGRVTVGRRQAGARVPTLSYTMVRPANVSVSLHDPGGRVFVVSGRRVSAGVHQVRIPADVPVRSGRWEVVVTAEGLDTQADASFTIAQTPSKPVLKPTNVPAGQVASEPRDGPVAPAEKATGGDDDETLWVLLGVGAALTLTAGIAVLTVRRARHR